MKSHARHRPGKGKTFGWHGVDALGRSGGAQTGHAQAAAGFFGQAGAVSGGDGSVRSAHYWAREIEKLGHTVS